MTLSNLSITNRSSVMVLAVLLTIGGLLSYLTIPKEAQPSIEVPNIVITTIYPGASPDDIESLITQKIEQEIKGVSDIKEIRSTSTEGVSTIVVEFEPDIAMDDAFQKIRDKVDLAKAELPGDVEEPLVNEIDFTQFPILTINLAADYPLARLKEVAEDMEEALEGIPSVLEVDVVGGLEREVQVNVDLSALQGYNLAFADVVDAIRNENTNLPGGAIDVDRLNYLVRIDGEFDDPAEVANLVVTAPGRSPIYVRDLATVDFGFKERDSFARLEKRQEKNPDGTYAVLPAQTMQFLPVISLNVKKRSGENILETVEAINTVLNTFPMPNGTQVAVTGDQSEFVEILITDLENNIISGLIFVVAVLLFFLGVRTSVLVSVAIPLSMFIAFIVFQALGYTLNFIILFSLIIALGMLVDNAIVIIENIYRYRSEGHPQWEATRLATAEVAWPVVASTATTVAVFIPMLFWPGIIGEFMSYMPLTLIVTLTCSLFVALVINPVITGYFMRLDGEPAKPMSPTAKLVLIMALLAATLVMGLANWRTLVVLAGSAVVLYVLHTRLFHPIALRFNQQGYPALVEAYRRFLNWALERDKHVRHFVLRNTLALGSLTVGFVLLALGGTLASLMGQTPALVMLVPGGVLFALGIVGVFVHSFEGLYLGGKQSVRAGLVFGVLSLILLGLMSLTKEITATTIAELMLMPGIIVGTGLLGMAFNRRRHLILTDNRARLLNGSLGALFTIVLMLFVSPPGTEFFPETDPRQVRITAEAQLGTNIETSNDIAQRLEERLQALLQTSPEAHTNIQNILTNVGVGADTDFGGGAASPERSRMTINIVDYEDRAETSSQTFSRLRDELQDIPGVILSFDKDDAGPPTGAPVNIEVSGEDFDQIIRITKDVRRILTEAAETSQIPGLVDVRDNLNTGRPELKVRINRERAAQFGLNTFDVANTVRSAINGVEASKYRDGEDDYDITVRLRQADRASLESLRNLTILHEGQQIPLVSLADLEVRGGLGSITRLDLSRVATVQADAAPGVNKQALLGLVQTHLAEYEQSIPVGYRLAYTGENQEQQESFSFLTTVLLIGSALVFLVMVSQFNSVSAPFIIMVAMGLSLVGVLLGLILTRTPFGLMTFIGVISLAGVVVNNSIVLVDYTMQLRRRGLPKREAVVTAGATRMRPVLLTALTTVLGLIPLTFGINVDFVGLLTRFEPNFAVGSENTQFWGPMGTAIISGLTFATFLTLVLVPVMYSSFDSVAQHLRTRFHRLDESPATSPTVSSEGNGSLLVPSGDGATETDVKV